MKPVARSQSDLREIFVVFRRMRGSARFEKAAPYGTQKRRAMPCSRIAMTSCGIENLLAAIC